MHYSLLKGNEGISLEKIRPDLPSDESMNWHSASESVGWGTPGAEILFALMNYPVLMR